MDAEDEVVEVQLGAALAILAEAECRGRVPVQSRACWSTKIAYQQTCQRVLVRRHEVAEPTL